MWAVACKPAQTMCFAMDEIQIRNCRFRDTALRQQFTNHEHV